MFPFIFPKESKIIEGLNPPNDASGIIRAPPRNASEIFRPPFDQKIRSAENTHKTWKNYVL